MPAPAFKKKPFLLFDDDNPFINTFLSNVLTPKTLVDVDMPAYLLNPATGNQWFGSGNTKANALLETSSLYHVATAVKVHARQGDDIDDYVVGPNGKITLQLEKGPQVIDPDLNVTQERLDRDKNNVDFVFTSNSDGKGMTQEQFHAKGGSHVIVLDADPGIGFDPFVLHSEWNPGVSTGTSDVIFVDENGVPRIIDNSGDAYDISNSLQLRFHGDVIDGDANTPGHQPFAGSEGDYHLEFTTYAPPPGFLKGLIGIPATSIHLDLDIV